MITQMPDELCFKFMHTLNVNDKFKLNEKEYLVKYFGKYNTVIKGDKKSFKTMTLKTDSCNIKFYFFYGISGNPKSKQRYSDAKQYNFLRNVEGQLIVDLLNVNNQFHEMSEIYKIATS